MNATTGQSTLKVGATIADLIKILKLIDLWRLSEVAQAECAYCWEMAHRILDTGSDLPTEDHHDDTAVSIALLCNPRNWGIRNPEWKAMCASLEPEPALTPSAPSDIFADIGQGGLHQ